jgi:hypothetical protein
MMVRIQGNGSGDTYRKHNEKMMARTELSGVAA